MHRASRGDRTRRDRRIPAIVRLEAAMVLASVLDRDPDDMAETVDATLDEARFASIAIDDAITRAAVAAFSRYGKGRGHPARLKPRRLSRLRSGECPFARRSCLSATTHAHRGCERTSRPAPDGALISAFSLVSETVASEATQSGATPDCRSTAANSVERDCGSRLLDRDEGEARRVCEAGGGGRHGDAIARRRSG